MKCDVDICWRAVDYSCNLWDVFTEDWKSCSFGDILFKTTIYLTLVVEDYLKQIIFELDRIN